MAVAGKDNGRSELRFASAGANYSRRRDGSGQISSAVTHASEGRARLEAGPAPILVAAHPGHELRLYGWCVLWRPTLFLLTDGSRGAENRQRVDASKRIAASLGMSPGCLFGEFSDRDVYSWITEGRVAPFVAWTARLAEWICAHQPPAIIADAWQGYNPSHDLTHLMARCAAGRAATLLGRPVPVFDYAVVPEQLAAEEPLGPVHEALDLNNRLVRKKLSAIGAFQGIEVEREQILALEGKTGMSQEQLHRPRLIQCLVASDRPQPEYERYGEARVASGAYRRVLRRSHVIAIAQGLLNAHADVFAAEAWAPVATGAEFLVQRARG